MSTLAMASMVTPRRPSPGWECPRSRTGFHREPLYIFSYSRSENIGSSPNSTGSRSCSTTPHRTGGLPRDAPMPVNPSSVSTRTSTASFFTFVPRSVRCCRSGGTGSDMGMARTAVIFIGRDSLAVILRLCESHYRILARFTAVRHLRRGWRKSIKRPRSLISLPRPRLFGPAHPPRTPFACAQPRRAIRYEAGVGFDPFVAQ